MSLIYASLCKYCLVSLVDLITYLILCSFALNQEDASAVKAAGKAWYQTMISDSDYTEFENFSKWLGVSQ